jgi:hypothetical protein
MFPIAIWTLALYLFLSSIQNERYPHPSECQNSKAIINSLQVLILVQTDIASRLLGAGLVL